MGGFKERYREYLEGIDREAYHAGEYHWTEGEYEVYRSHPWSPPGCHDSCGCLFYLKDGKLAHVEGDPLEPYNGGKLCMRCLNMMEATNHETRVKYPMKRAGERGEGKWERISWDEALDLIAEKITYYKEMYGPQAVWIANGTGRGVFWGTGMLAYVGAETPNQDIMFNIGHSCYTPRLISTQQVYGDYFEPDASFTHEERYLHPEWQAPKVIIIWGVEPLRSNADGYLGHWLNCCVQEGSKIISVDPRLTWWSARSEYFLQLRPGTDAALAMAMINQIVKDDLYDHDFVEKWTYGFDAMCQAVAEMTPAKAAEICDLDEEDIIGAARLFATEGPSTVKWGLSLEQQPNALLNDLAILDMMAICGYVDCPGGGVLVRDAFNHSHHMTENYCPEENRNLRPSKSTADAPWGETRKPLWDWEARAPERARMVFFMSCNTLGNTAGYPERVYEMLKKFEFVVGVDPFITPTSSALADLLIPTAMSIEANDIRSWWTPLRQISKIAQYYEAMDDRTFALSVMHRLHGDDKLEGVNDSHDLCDWRLEGESPSRIYPADDAETGLDVKKQFNWRSAGEKLSADTHPEGYTFEDLKKDNYKYDTFCDTYYKYEKGILRPDGQPGFNTQTGRIELYSLGYEFWGCSPVPAYFEIPVSPVSTPEIFEKYPLILNSGPRSYEFFHSEHRQLPTMREFHQWPQVCMNQNVADRFGIEEGQWTWIENDHGRFKQVAHIVPTMKDYVISAESGWWYPEDEGAAPTLFRTFDSNPNNCIDIEETGYYGVGDCGKTTPVTIYPVKEGDVTPTEQIMLHGGFPEQKARRERLEADWKARGVENN